MRIAVVGAGGLLGRSLVAEASRAGDEVTALPRAACDITDRGAVLAAVAGHDRIVNAAAYTDVDGAETNEDAAYRANALGPEILARAARSLRVPLLHVSTDFVFDGTKSTPYDELDAAAPIGVYGRSKWAGEELARAAFSDVWVVRVQALYGEGGRNFASRIRALLLDAKPFTVDREREAQPTWVRTAARTILTIVRGESFGTYHVSTTGKTTWAAFAHHLADRLGVAPAFSSVATRELATRATRPARSLFSHRLSQLRGIGELPSWEDDVESYLRSIAEAR